MDGVGTPIIGRPRPLPGHDTPNPAYHPHTLNYEEPEKLAFAKAALALAGHEVTDLALCNILEQQACGNLTGEQARAAIRKHVQG